MSHKWLLFEINHVGTKKKYSKSVKRKITVPSTVLSLCT